jgi:VWFA-related protein
MLTLLILFSSFVFQLGSIHGSALDVRASRLQDASPEVNVTLKLVQVFVTDKNGAPVLDLEPSDFELYDSGKKQVIVAFERHGFPPERELPGEEKPKLPAPRMNRKLFFFFDFAFNDPGGIAMARRAALDFLDRYVKEPDEVGIITYSVDRGIRLQESLSTDYPEIRRLIGELGKGGGLGRAGRFLEELRTDRDAKADLGTLSERHRAAKDALLQIGGVSQYQQEVLAFSSSLKELATALRYSPGYKNIILFSAGIPDALMYQMADQIAPEANKMNFNASDGLNSRLRYENMVRELAAANCPVFAVNVEGLSSRFKELDFEEAVPRPRLTANPSPFIDRGRKGDGSLKEIAKSSGGEYFGDQNDHERINRRIQDITGTFYVLGYRIDDRQGGKYRPLNIKLKKGGYSVRYPRGYYESKPYAKLSDLEKELQLVDLAFGRASSDVALRPLPSLALVSPTDQSTNLVLLAKVPAELSDRSSKEDAEALALVLDGSGGLIGQKRTKVPSTHPSASEAVFAQAFPNIPPGRFECRLIIRGMESGLTAYSTITGSVPRRFDPGMKLYPPLVLVPGESGVFLEDVQGGPEEGTRALLTRYFTVDAPKGMPLMGCPGAKMRKLALIVPCTIIQFEPKNVMISAQLTDMGSGEVRSAPISILGRTEDQDTVFYTAGIDVTGLGPSRYTLYLFAWDVQTSEVFSYTSAVICLD